MNDDNFEPQVFQFYQSALMSEGMTLRDYFAARAMSYTIEMYHTYESAAESAYCMADAMLEARKRNE